MILSLVDDLMFSSKVKEAAKSSGAEIITANNEEKFQNALLKPEIHTVLIDLACKKLDPFAAIKSIKEQLNAKVIVYYSHVETESAAAAKAAGADEVLPRSKFVQVLPDIIAPK